jgi:hypothetical protein
VAGSQRRTCAAAVLVALCWDRANFSAGFELLESASRGWEVGAGAVGALIHPSRRATFLRGVDRWNGMWRDGVPPVSSGVRTRRVKTAVVGWATAESPATGCGADHDRMASLRSRSSQLSRWRNWVRAWGSDESVTNDPAA